MEEKYGLLNVFHGFSVVFRLSIYSFEFQCTYRSLHLQFKYSERQLTSISTHCE